MRKIFARILIVLILTLGLSIVPKTVPVFATGNVYVNPSQVNTLPVGNQFTVQIKVSGMDQFNGYEIQVVSDPSVISPVSISTSGNIFQANTTGGIGFELRNNVNGVGTGSCLNNSCAPQDGVGIADSAYGDTKPVSGSGLLFTVTYQVVSNKPLSAISIQNEQFSNGGNSGVPHTTTAGQYGSPVAVAVSSFFTDGGFNPLVSDGDGNPSLVVVFARGIIRSTNPGEILAWVQVSNTGLVWLQSLNVTETLPADWEIHPASTDAVHVYFGDSTTLATNPEITDPSTIVVTTGNPATVALSITSFNNTAIAHPLQPGQSIVFSVQLQYGLKKTQQSISSFPRTYTDSASAVAFAQPSYTGAQGSGTGSALFVAYLNIVGNPGHDAPKVDIKKYSVV